MPGATRRVSGSTSVPPERVTTAPSVRVRGSHTSGEVEFVLFKTGSGTLVTVGSDHTDRELEKSDVPLSKAVCPKVVAPVLLSELMLPGDLESRLAGRLPELSAGELLFSGTIPSMRGLVISDVFAMELVDEVTGRTIRHSYRVVCLSAAAR